MPGTICYKEAARRLHVGAGWIDNVPPAVWAYEVFGKQVLAQWFSYRGRDRSRPLIGDRRPPSPLGDIQPAGWPAWWRWNPGRPTCSPASAPAPSFPPPPWPGSPPAQPGGPRGATNGRAS